MGKLVCGNAAWYQHITNCYITVTGAASQQLTGEIMRTNISSVPSYMRVGEELFLTSNTLPSYSKKLCV